MSSKLIDNGVIMSDKKRVTILLTEEQLEQIGSRAAARGLSLSAYIRQCVLEKGLEDAAKQEG